MEDTITSFCYETEIDWEAFLQQLPESPAICLDDFLFPLTEERSEDEISPSIDGCLNGEGASEPGGFTLDVLSDILLKDEEDFDFSGAGEYLEMKSFLEEPCDGTAQNDVDVDEGNGVDVVELDRPAGGEEEKGVENFSRKRKRESAVKSRERKKLYEKSLESNCRMLEKECRSLEQSLTYSAMENVVLKHEVTRMKTKEEEAKPGGYNGGGRAEPAALFVDSLQKESLLCLLMTWLMLVVLLVRRLPPSPAPLRAVVMVVILEKKIGKYGSRSFTSGGRREWKWRRKKPK